MFFAVSGDFLGLPRSTRKKYQWTEHDAALGDAAVAALDLRARGAAGGVGDRRGADLDLLADDVARVCDRLGLPFDPKRMPAYKTGIRHHRIPLREY